jgi:integrase
MARSHAKPLTAVAVANARPGHTRREIHDGGCHGLFLVLQPSGHKSWACRYRFKGLSRKLTLGDALIGRDEGIEPASDPQLDTPLSLMAARELAIKALRQAKSGTDPATEKRQKKSAQQAADSNTLQAVCDTFLELVERERPMRTIDQRRSDLKLICDKLGQLPLDTITREQFVHTFDNISRSRGPVRSDRCLMSAKRLLKWYSGRRSNYINVLANVERRTSIKKRARKRVLSDDELLRIWLAAETFPGPFGAYIQFLLLTACRRNEAGGMRRSELLDASTWVLPRGRWKSGEKIQGDLLIPLSKAAQAIVAARPEGDEFIFGGRRPLGNFDRHKRAFDAACGVTGWTLHDCRRTARTLLSKVAAADVCDRCMGHAITGARAHYDMYEYVDERRIAFQKLAALIQRIVHPPSPATVTDLAAERKRMART